MNMELFRLINNLAGKNGAMDGLMIFFSKYAPYLFMAVIAIVFIQGVIKKDSDSRKAAFNTFILTVINLGIGFVIGNIYYEDRPFVHNKVNLLFSHSVDASFPSDHATGTMSIALGLRWYNKAVSIVMTILSLVVGFSRVYVGHHYPGDVLGAYIISFAVYFIYGKILRDKVGSLYEAVEKKLLAVTGLEKLGNKI